jgi:hypothetical protein
MTLTLVIEKIVAFEMSRKMGQEEATSSKPYDFACDENNKGKKKAPSSSSSSEMKRNINNNNKMMMNMINPLHHPRG